MAKYPEKQNVFVRVPERITLIRIEFIFKHLFIVFQIRQEKPFYMADAEVDSLVSTISVHSSVTHVDSFLYDPNKSFL